MNIQYLSKRAGSLLAKRRMTIAVAESCTGGMIGGIITAVPGSSRYFLGGVIAYDNRIKRRVLHVPQATLNRHGAVSGQTVAAMARGVKRLFKTRCAIAVSGVAGPEGGTKGKPVGLVYIAVVVGNIAKKYECRFSGTRSVIRRQTVEESLRRLIRLLYKNATSWR
jgi:PncC family amidohydrolase